MFVSDSHVRSPGWAFGIRFSCVPLLPRWANRAELKEAAIKFENLDTFGQVGKTASGTLGEIVKVEVTPIAGGTNQDKPLVVENEAEPGLKWTALGKTSNSFYRSAGKDYKFDGTSGESHRFAMKDGGEK